MIPCLRGRHEVADSLRGGGERVPESMRSASNAQKLDQLWPETGLVIARYRKIPGRPELSGDLGLQEACESLELLDWR